MKVKEIIIYPIKGLGGISVSKCKVGQNGLENDRIYMLADLDGQLISQRTTNQLALMNVNRGLDRWEVSYNQRKLRIEDYTISKNEIEVEVWGSKFICNEVSSEYSAWFSKALGLSAKLVVMPGPKTRIKEFNKPPYKTTVSFADGYPVMLLGTESVALLNKKLLDPVHANRFRANIIIDTDHPHVEDEWNDFKIGEYTKFRNIKPCMRCQVITINQESGTQGKEPLKTLSSYRKFDNNVFFGTNAIILETGVIKLGDPIVQL